MWFQETELQILETVIIFVEVLQNVYCSYTLLCISIFDSVRDWAMWQR